MLESLYPDSPTLLILATIAFIISCLFPVLYTKGMTIRKMPSAIWRLLMYCAIWNLGSIIGIQFYSGDIETGTFDYACRQIVFGIQALAWIRIGYESYHVGELASFEKHDRIRLISNTVGSIVIIALTLTMIISPQSIENVSVLDFKPFHKAPTFTLFSIVYMVFMLPGIVLAIFQLFKSGLNAIEKVVSHTNIYMALIYSMFTVIAFLFDIVIPMAQAHLTQGEASTGNILFLAWTQFLTLFLTILCSQYYSSVSFKNKSSYWFLNKLISKMDEGIIYFDDKGRVQFANQGAANLLKISTVNLKGRSIKSLFPPYLEFFKDTVYTDIHMNIGGEEHSFKIHFFRNNQTLTTILNIAFFVDQSKTLLLQQNLKTLNDQYLEYTHDLVRYQDRLDKEASVKAEKENVLNTLINALPFCVWYKNERGIYQKQNQLDIGRNGSREGTSDDPKLITSFETDARELGEAKVNTTFEDKNGNEISQDEANKLVKEGENYSTYENMYIPIVEGKAPFKTLCIKVDMTEQRRLEQERNMLREQKLIHSRLEELGTMCGAFAHDYNNILGSQIGFCQLAQEVLPPDNPANMFISEALKAAQRGKVSLEELLNTIRGKTNAATPAVVFAPYMIIEEVVKRVSLTVSQAITINSQDLDKSLKIRGISASLDRIISNMANNAIFAMKKTGGELTFKLHKRVLDKELLTPHAPPVPAGSYAQMDISDTGSGMDSGTLERIFAPFFTTKAPGEGLGLGLSSALRLLKEGNAYFTVETTLGKGTTFNLYWPLEQENKED